MREEEFLRHAELEESHWWFLLRRGIIDDILATLLPPGSLIAEIGCGTGGNLRHLSRRYRVVGSDLSPVAVSFARSLGGETVLEGDFAETLSPWQWEIDGILLADVIEHIVDDRAFLRRVASFIRPGGVLLVTVPASPWLFGHHDRAVGHYRRYRAKALRRVVTEAGFEEIRLTHFFSPFLPLIALVRFMSRGGSSLAPPHPLVNSLCLAVGGIERLLLRHISLPFGSSILILARKPEES